MKKNLSILAFSVIAASHLSAVTITSFGSSSAPIFSIEASITTAGFASQNSDSIDLSGTDLGSSLGGIIPSVNLLQDETVVTLYLYGTVTNDPGSPFTISLFDPGFEAPAVFTGGSWGDIQANGFTALTYSSGAIDSTDIAAVQLDTAGAGSSLAANLTLLSTVPVPEPATYAALSGVLALTWVMLRRRRV